MMLALIEEKIIERLKDKGLNELVKNFEIREGPDNVIQTPAVRVAIESAAFDKVTQTTYKQDVNIFLVIVFKHLRNEEERRKGMYPILQGIIDILTLQNLGLKINLLVPINYNRINSTEGYIAYEIKFKSGFTVEKTDDEKTTDLLKIGLEYYLKPGDEVKDASDEVTLGN